MRLLSDVEQNIFREDYRQTETEIQKSIAVYLSALVVATGWVFGPQAKPLDQMFLGNEGANLFGLVILLALNAVFTCFLTYKSIHVHEIMQFVIRHSPRDSALDQWEGWRRSSDSLSKRWLARPLYFFVISLIPLWASCLIFVGTASYIRKPVPEIVELMHRSEVPPVSTIPDGKSERLTKTSPTGEDLVARVKYRVRLAKFCLVVVTIFHAIPIWFFIVTWVFANSKWKEIRALKRSSLDF
jgi:hypothetical protein